MAARTSVETVDSTVTASGSVFDSIQQGASEIQSNAAEALPATGRFLGRIIYNTTYAVSFGVTLPVMMIVRVVPRDNALVHGLVDGALAARDRVNDWGLEMEHDRHDGEDEGSHGLENGAAHHPDSADHSTHRRPRAKKTAARKTSRSSPRKKS